jgi:hypothetical protein
MTTDFQPSAEFAAAIADNEIKMRTDRDALWQAVLAKVDEVAKHGGRSQAFYGGDGYTCMAIATKSQDDGTEIVYEITARDNRDRLGITVSVAESVRVHHGFWKPIADHPDRSERVVIGDRCYTVRPDSSSPGRGDGFSGRRHVIEWLDESGEPTGETTVTRNLWYRGVIPQQYRDRLAPNARFGGVA